MKRSLTARNSIRIWRLANLGLPLALIAGGCVYEVPPDRVTYQNATSSHYVYRDAPAPSQYEAPGPANYDASAPPSDTIADDETRYEPPPQDVEVVYQQDLAPYGRWVNTQEYGRCWAPNDCPHDWQPYTVGHWE